MGAARSRPRLLSDPAGSPPRATKGPGAREAWVLGLSALVVIASAASARNEPATATVPSALPSPLGTATAGLPPPLPSGAAVHAMMDELPAESERTSGCHFEERGDGDYGAPRRLTLAESLAPVRLLVPAGRALADDGSFRLLVHFHGADPVRKQLAPEGMDLVIATVDAGTGSHAYARALSKGAFAEIVRAAEREVAAASGVSRAWARAVVVSSWSAGYGAVAQILARPHPELAALVLLDSLYAGYAPGTREVERADLALFVEAARDALRGGPLFYLTHSAVATPGYASTGEVATFLLDELGARPLPLAPTLDPPTAATAPTRHPLTRLYEASHLTIRGYAGGDRDAHCAQLHLLPAILRDVVLPALPR
jgi:hypothetical protein